MNDDIISKLNEGAVRGAAQGLAEAVDADGNGQWSVDEQMGAATGAATAIREHFAGNPEMLDKLATLGHMGNALCQTETGRGMINGMLDANQKIREGLMDPESAGAMIANVEEGLAAAKENFPEAGLDEVELNPELLANINAASAGIKAAIPGGMEQVHAEDVCSSGVFHALTSDPEVAPSK